jgi:26S proteasome regulatory subunit T5
MSKKLEDVVQSMDIENDPDLLQGTPQDILNRARMIDGQTKILDSEINAINSEIKGMKERLKENAEKIKMHKQLPYLVGHVVEVSTILSIYLYIL